MPSASAKSAAKTLKELQPPSPHASPTLERQCFLLRESLQAQLALADIYIKSAASEALDVSSLIAEDKTRRVHEAVQHLTAQMTTVLEEDDEEEESEDEVICDVDAEIMLQKKTSEKGMPLALAEQSAYKPRRSLGGTNAEPQRTTSQPINEAATNADIVQYHSAGSNGTDSSSTMTSRPSNPLQRRGSEQWVRRQHTGTRASPTLQLEMAMERPKLWNVWNEDTTSPRLMKVSATEILQDGDGSQSVFNSPSWAVGHIAQANQMRGLPTYHRVASRYGDSNTDWMSILVIPPNSLFTLLVDFVSLLMITWDLITLPLFAFNLQTDAVISVINLITSVYWAVELPLPFFTGYFKGSGKIELRFSRCCRRYLRSWFLPQLFLVVTDIGALLVGEGGGEAVSIFRSSRVFRVAKIARLARILKISSVLERLEGFTSLVVSEMLQASISLLCLAVLTGMTCHAFACFWYALGTRWSDDLPRSMATETGIEEFDITFQYMLCFQWVWAQFTPAPPPRGMEPFNDREAVFAIVLRVFGLVLFSSFVGSVTAMIAQARKGLETRWKENMQMRLYFKDNSVPFALCMNIMAFLLRKRQKRKALLEHQVTLLKSLPYSMLSELRLQVWGPVLAVHPLFMHLAHSHTPTMRQVCGTALTERSVEVGEEIVHYGRVADAMYFVREREVSPKEAVEYFAGVHVTGKKPTSIVYEGGWFGEVALWLAAGAKDARTHHPWRHHGHAMAIRDCALVELHGDRFREIVLEHPMALRSMQHYAAEFLASMPNQIEQLDIVGSESQVMSTLNRCFEGAQSDVPSLELDVNYAGQVGQPPSPIGTRKQGSFLV